MKTLAQRDGADFSVTRTDAASDSISTAGVDSVYGHHSFNVPSGNVGNTAGSPQTNANMPGGFTITYRTNGGSASNGAYSYYRGGRPSRSYTYTIGNNTIRSLLLNDFFRI